MDRKPPPRKKHRFLRFIFRHLTSVAITLAAVALFAVVVLPHVIITVPPGQVGVLWKRFNGFGIYCWCFVGRGTVLNHAELRQEGLHAIWPWDKLFFYDLRLQSVRETYDVISKDGVNLTASINIRFQLKNDSVAVLHKYVGPEYEASIVRPEIGSQVRQIMAKYTAEQIYSTSRQTIESEVQQSAQLRLGENLNHLIQPGASEQPNPQRYAGMLEKSVDFIDTLVLGIQLPSPVIDAINRKTEQFYRIQEYEYRVEREAIESRRKQIEAGGIAAFQKTVSEGISDSYLRWRGIEATLELAQSKNAKVVIIGGGKDGLPIILGNADVATPQSVEAGGDGQSPRPKAKMSGALTKVFSMRTQTPSKRETQPGSTSAGTPLQLIEASTGGATPR